MKTWRMVSVVVVVMVVVVRMMGWRSEMLAM
jgi:hypothetical protein